LSQVGHWAAANLGAILAVYLEPDFDLVVIGGGPAGSAAGMRARQLGLRVAIIDKARFPRDKLCGGLVSGRSLGHLQRIFGLEPTAPMFKTARAVRFDWQGEALSQFEAPHNLHFTMRADFDAWLLAQAQTAGCQVFTGQRSFDLDEGNALIKLQDLVLSYRALIGADGVNSAVARHLFGRAFDPATIGFGLECEIARGPEHAEIPMQIDFRAVDWGYGWVFPKADSLTVGIAGLQAENADFKARMAAYLQAGGFDAGAARIKGHFIPFGDFSRNPGRDNILLAGDAAGLVDPMTGEGIAHAIDSGALAAEAVATALQQGAPARALAIYKGKLRPLHRELGKVNRLRGYAFQPGLATRFRDKLTNSEALQQAFFDLLEGHMTYSDLERQFARKALRLDRWLPGLFGR